MQSVGPRVHTQTRRPVLLIVDDEPDILASLRTLLEQRIPAAEVVCAASLDEARALFHARITDVLLVDQRLGDQSGLALLDDVARSKPDVPVILMTGFRSERFFRDVAQHRQVLAVVPKPFDVEPLVVLLKGQLDRRRGDIRRIPPLA